MDSDLLSHVVAVLVSFCVGLPILARGLRAGDRPVALLGAAVTIDGLEWLLWLMAAFTPLRDTPAEPILASACRLGIVATTSLMLGFTLLVFRRDSRGALAAFWILNAAMAVSLLASGAVGDWRGARSDLPWVWLENGAQVGAYGWAAAEAFAHYSNMRRRSAIGLVDPLVANRFRLWGLYASMFVLTQVGYFSTLVLFVDLPAFELGLTLLTIGGEMALWFAFFPPAWYAQRVANRLGETA
ncbi:MAG: hypothetical protein OEM49_03725 [Myxococcales bacterium]|nr:hypothetical protein [Myxococcales bacterium]